jgi:hypothetical protein
MKFERVLKMSPTELMVLLPREGIISEFRSYNLDYDYAKKTAFFLVKLGITSYMRTR